MKFNNLTWPTELSPRAMAGICLTIACLFLGTLVYSFWQWRQDWTLAHLPSPVNTIMPTVSAAPDLVASINSNHLFGHAAKLGDIPITNLQFQVTGIVKAENSTSKAYISIAGNSGKIYKPGDILPYGVKVYDIKSDAVVLENDGQLEKLPLPRTKLQFKTRTSS